MKKLFYSVIIAIILIPLLSIAQTKLIERRIGHVYFLSVPNYMTATKDLNKSASLQYQNTLKEAYVIVIEDNKAELDSLGIRFTDPQDFYDGFITDFTADLENKKFTGTKRIKIKKNNAVQSEVSAIFNGNPIWYLITVVESPTHFYKIISWTLEENKEKLKPDYIKMVNSFHE
ncbi:MAG: hypothetical protein A2X61_04225 [Ignavibacteria bacterium GWB2_35_12]|nr:MAG: hypothetical protein A2X63_08790 [Ignavibacteria bacterium GWA2_35_8]OGU38887.1 MAG: hypothetical protein A2X61_04225 [Ignavibacteria bacterium GWB2_35_12]OGU85913.1 MAG: hypothetical protein A2220_04930 [Ignavibacteria bacterium RIFOXYA2_FULL_35_10]OGV20341.1 MAG: hypothetical protein A2475_12000 [Ignavibacteria bacterium RIFOXYC2_FULL_35_21]